MRLHEKHKACDEGLQFARRESPKPITVSDVMLMCGSTEDAPLTEFLDALGAAALQGKLPRRCEGLARGMMEAALGKRIEVQVYKRFQNATARELAQLFVDLYNEGLTSDARMLQRITETYGCP